MAEFCTKCQIKLGMQPVYEKPIFCEECGETFSMTLFDVIIEKIRMLLAIITAVIIIVFISIIIYFIFSNF